MAFGAVRGTLQITAASITNPFAATGSVAVSAGDLGVAVIGERTSLTMTTVTDNLGNTWVAEPTGGADAGNATGKLYYFYFASGGTLTSVSGVATASVDDAAFAVVVYEGPFNSSPLDANPALITNDTTTPYVGPASGTLSQADELVVGWITMTNCRTMTISSPFTVDNTIISGADGATNTIGTAIASEVVSATTTQSPSWTAAGGSIASDVLGTISFKKLADTTPRGWTSHFGSTQVPIFPAKLQDYDTFQLEGRIDSITPQGWSNYHDRARIFFPAHRQRFDSFQAQGTIFSLVPQGGWSFPYDRTQIAPFPAKLQDYDTFQPEGRINSITPQGWSNAYANAVIKISPLKLQYVDVYKAQEVVTVYLASSYSPSITPVEKYPLVSQRYDGFQPLGYVPVDAIGWGQGWPSTVFFSSPDDKQFDCFQTPGPIVSTAVVYTVVQANYDFVSIKHGNNNTYDALDQKYPFANPQGFEGHYLSVRIKPKLDQKYDTLNQVYPFVNPQGFEGHYLSIRIKPKLDQKYDAFQAQGRIDSTTPQGWSYFYDRAKIAAFVEKLQDYDTFQPEGTINSTTPQGWSYYHDRAKIATFAEKLQKYDAFQVQGSIFSITPQGWSYFYNWAAIKAFASSKQTFDTYPAQGNVPTADTPQGWTIYYQYGQKPPTAALQQFGTFSPFGNLASIETPQGWVSSYGSARIAGFPVQDQMYDAYGSFAEPPPPPVQTTVHFVGFMGMGCGALMRGN